MIPRTHNFMVAQRAHYQPKVLVFLTSTMTMRVYGAKYPGDEIGGGMEFWDSTYTVGDGGTFGSQIGISDAQARVIQFGSIKQQLIRNTKDIITSLSQSETAINQLVLDNADGYFSRMLSAAYKESFINQKLEIKIGFPGLTYADYLPIASGIILDEKLNNKTLTLSYVGLTSSIFETWELPKTDRYANSSVSNGLLPIVLGDMTENSGNQGIWVCPNIAPNTYCISGCAILSAMGGNSFTFYDGDGDLISSGASVTTAGDFEGQGIIAYVVFSSVQKEPITCQCKGAINSAGDLITNPIDVISFLFDLAGDATEFNATTLAFARSHATAEAYYCAGIIQSNQSLAAWLTNIMSSFLGSWYLNYEDQLMLTFLTDESQRGNVDGILNESNYLSSPTASRTHSTLCNQPIIAYAYAADRSDKRFKNDASTYYLQEDDGTEYIDADSLRLYGERKISLNLNFCRNTPNIQGFSNYLVEYYAAPIWEIPIVEQGFDNIHIEINDPIIFSLRELYDIDNLAYQNQIGWILQKNIDLDNLTVEWQLLDTGDCLPEYPDIWDGTHTVGDGRHFGGDRYQGVLY